MKFRWKTWRALPGISACLIALITLGTTPVSAVTYDVWDLTDLENAFLAGDADMIILKDDIPLPGGFDFANDTENITIDTAGFKFTFAGGTKPTQTGTGILTFTDSVTPGNQAGLSFSGFSSVDSEIRLLTATNVIRVITPAADLTDVGDGASGSLTINQNGSIWNALGDVTGTDAVVTVDGNMINVNAGDITLGTAGDGTFSVEGEQNYVEVGDITFGAGGTGTLTVDGKQSVVSAGHLTFGANGDSTLNVTNIGTLAVKSLTPSVTGLTTINISGMDPDIDVVYSFSDPKSRLLVDDGTRDGSGIFIWDTETTVINITDGGFLNFGQGYKVYFEDGLDNSGAARVTDIILDNASHIWAGTQSLPGTRDIIANAELATDTTSRISLANGSVLYATGDFILETTVNGEFQIDLTSVDSDNGATCIMAFGDIKIQGDGTTTLSVSEKASVSALGNFTMNMTGSTQADPEISIKDSYSSLSAGENTYLTTIGESWVVLSGGGYFETTKNVELTADTTGILHLDVSGTGVYGSEKYGSAFLVGGNLTVFGEGQTFIDLSDGGIIEVRGNTTLGTDTGRVEVLVSGKGDGEYSNSTWSNYGDMIVGDAADSDVEVNIVDEGYIETGRLIVGNQAGSNGAVNLTGISASELSYLDFGNAAIIGKEGTGALNVNAYASAYGTALTVGSALGSEGIVNVQGKESVLYVYGATVIGEKGLGEVFLSDNADMTTASLVLGKDATGDGTLDITGGTLTVVSGSTPGSVIIGSAGTGVINLSNGVDSVTGKAVKGIVTSGKVTMGEKKNASGELNISNKGTWTSSDVFLVGALGDAEISVTGGGKLIAAGMYVGTEKSGNGIINVSGADSELHITAVGSQTCEVGEGSGILNVKNGARMTIDAGGEFSMNGNAVFDGSGTSLHMESNFSTSKFSYLVLNNLTFRNGSTFTGNGGVFMQAFDAGGEMILGNVYINSGSSISPGIAESGKELGYLHIEGNLWINGDGIYKVDLANGIDNCDFIEVVGNVDLSGAVFEINILDNLTYSGNTWEILRVDDEHTIYGSLGTDWTLDLGNAPKFITFVELEKDNDKNIVLGIERNPYFRNKGKDHNAAAVGNALDSVSLERWFRELDKLSQGTDAQLNDAMHQMSGSIHANAMMLARQNLWFPIGDRISWDVCEKAYFGAENPYSVRTSDRSAVWVTPNYHYFKTKSSKGLDSYNMNAFNILVGLDTIFEDNFAGGIYGIFGSPKMEQGYDEARADTFGAGLHAAYRFLYGFEVKGMAAYSYHKFSIDRNMRFHIGSDNYYHHAHSKFDGSNLTVNMEFARPIFLPRIVLRPLVAVDLDFVWMDSAIEEDAGLYNLAYEKSHSTWAFLRVGGNVDFAGWWDRLNIRGRFFYAVQLNEPEARFRADFVGEESTMTIYGTDPGRHYFNLGLTAHLTLGVQRRVALFANYDTYISGKSNSQMVGGGMQVLY